MSEWMLRDTSAAHGLGYVTLRYFNVAGADPMLRSGQASPLSTHLIKVASEAAIGQRARLDVFGDDYPTPDGTCVRDYIHVTDLALAHVEALRHLRDGGENLTLNCGYGRGYSVFEVIEAVKRASGADFPVRVGARRPGDPAAIVASADRIRQTLDWQPQYDDLATIVRHALAWERKISAKPSAAA
jgi:UDP-glucose 4-epimerase